MYTDKPDEVLPVSRTVAEVVEFAGSVMAAPAIVLRARQVPAAGEAERVIEKAWVPVEPPAPRATSPALTTWAFLPAMAAEFAPDTVERVLAITAEDVPPATRESSEATTALVEEDTTPERADAIAAEASE